MMNKSGQGSIADTLTYIHTFSKPLIYLSCFISCYKVIEYQSFQKVKHTTLMFHFWFHVSFFKTLRERFHAPSVFLNRSHRGFESLPQCFCFLPQCFLNETLKLKVKHKNRMFQSSKVLIINKLKY